MTEDAGQKSRGPAWAVALSTAGGVGFTPRMPGTLGALVGVVLYLPALFMPREWVFILVLWRRSRWSSPSRPWPCRAC